MKKGLGAQQKVICCGNVGGTGAVGIAGLQTNSGVSDFAQDCPE